MRLTQEDVKRLLSEAAPEARAAVVQKIAEDHSAGLFRPNEILIAEQIFRLLLRDAEVQVRAAMAESLKHDNTVPKDIIKSLASDDEAVALPLLTYSDVLDDNDLIEIVRQNEQITKHIAIANRKQVSPSVSAALVDTENSDVVTSLVKNKGADISEKSFQKIVDEFGQNQHIIDVVVKRANLPVTVVENLLNIVSDSVAQELKQKYTGASRKLEEEARKTRESMTLKLLETTIEPEQVIEMVDQLYDAHRLTPSIILTALCRGNFNFFEYSLAKMAGIPIDNARKLINDKGDLGFKSLYKKAELPDSMFEACRLVLDVMREMHEKGEVRPGNIHYANRAVEKIFVRAEGREVENLAYIIALIRQNVH